MKKLFTFGIWIVLLFVVVSSTAQRRYFYSLKYVKVGQNNVKPPYSAGMYVTFPASKMVSIYVMTLIVTVMP